VSTGALILLDTTVLIDVSRGREPASSWLDEKLRQADRVCVSAVSVAELFAGLPPALRAEWQRFIGDLTHWDVTEEIAVLAGTMRYDLARQGRTILTPDALIAATAAHYGASVATANTRDFVISGVTIVRLAH
jgi:predicted nucleic acid-binding protein